VVTTPQADPDVATAAHLPALQYRLFVGEPQNVVFAHELPTDRVEQIPLIQLDEAHSAFMLQVAPEFLFFAAHLP
jgi:hypothetical protein